MSEPSPCGQSRLRRASAGNHPTKQTRFLRRISSPRGQWLQSEVAANMSRADCRRIKGCTGSVRVAIQQGQEYATYLRKIRNLPDDCRQRCLFASAFYSGDVVFASLYYELHDICHDISNCCRIYVCIAAASGLIGSEPSPLPAGLAVDKSAAKTTRPRRRWRCGCRLAQRRRCYSPAP